MNVVNTEKWKYVWRTAFLLYSVQVKDTLVFVWQLENVSQLYRLLITTVLTIWQHDQISNLYVYMEDDITTSVCYSNNTSFNNMDKHVFTTLSLDEPVVRTPRAPLCSHWPWFYAPDQIISIKHMWSKKIRVCSVLLGAISDPTDVNAILCARSFEIGEYITDIRRSGRAQPPIWNSWIRHHG